MTSTQARARGITTISSLCDPLLPHCHIAVSIQPSPISNYSPTGLPRALFASQAVGTLNPLGGTTNLYAGGASPHTLPQRTVKMFSLHKGLPIPAELRLNGPERPGHRRRELGPETGSSSPDMYVAASAASRDVPSWPAWSKHRRADETQPQRPTTRWTAMLGACLPTHRPDSPRLYMQLRLAPLLHHRLSFCTGGQCWSRVGCWRRRFEDLYIHAAGEKQQGSR